MVPDQQLETFSSKAVRATDHVTLRSAKDVFLAGHTNVEAFDKLQFKPYSACSKLTVSHLDHSAHVHEIIPFITSVDTLLWVDHGPAFAGST